MENENYQMIEEVNHVIWRPQVVGFLRAHQPGSDTSHSLDLLFVGNHCEWVSAERMPIGDIIGVLCEAEVMVRRSSEKETFPWIGNLAFRWPA